MIDNVPLLQLIIEGLFTIIMAGIGVLLKNMSSDIRGLRDAIGALQVQMVTDFVPKDEWLRVRDQMHNLRNDVSAIQFIVDQFDRRRNHSAGETQQ